MLLDNDRVLAWLKGRLADRDGASAMGDHLACGNPGAPRQVVRYDVGGWISGPSLPHGIEPLPADLVEPGDVLALDDGTRAEVTDVGFGFYYLAEGRGQGVAIGWRAGPSSGLMFRKGSDVLNRVAGG